MDLNSFDEHLRWFAALGAIDARFHGALSDYLGGLPRSVELRGLAPKLLKSWFTIDDAASLVPRLEELEARELGWLDELLQGDGRESAKLSKEAADRRPWFRRNRELLERTRLDASHASRRCVVYGWAACAGWIPADDAYCALGPYPDRVRRQFSSWPEYGAAFLVQELFVNTGYPARRTRVYCELLADPESIWNVVPFELRPLVSDDAVPAVALALSLSCPTCTRQTPVNGAMTQVTCLHCLSTFVPAQAFWREVKVASATAAKLPLHVGSETKNYDDDALHRVGYAREPLACSCGKALTIDQLERGQSEGQVVCGACAKTICVREATPWARELLPEARWIVGECGADQPRKGANPARAITVSCDSCGAPLALSELHRTYRCGHCAAQHELDENTWHAMVGPARRQAWYLVPDPARS